MKNTLLVVGIATIDHVASVEEYPKEDSKIRANGMRKSRGGNATNTAVISSQLGTSCSWIGTITNPEKDEQAKFVCQDLAQYNVDYSSCEIVNEGSMPISLITITSKSPSTRTIVHHRNLPELSLEQFKFAIQNAINQRNLWKWIHFEGRNNEVLLQMLDFLYTTLPNPPKISIEIEAIERNSWEHVNKIVPYTSVVFFSKTYVNHIGYQNPVTFLQFLCKNINFNKTKVICAWGDAGAFAINEQRDIIQSSSYPSNKGIVDTVGAGDAFNAGVLTFLLKNKHLQQAIQYGCRVAGYKCGQFGFHLSEDEIHELGKK